MLTNFIMSTFSLGESQRNPHIAKEEMVPPHFHYPPLSSLSNEIDSSPNIYIFEVDEASNEENFPEKEQVFLIQKLK